MSNGRLPDHALADDLDRGGRGWRSLWPDLSIGAFPPGRDAPIACQRKRVPVAASHNRCAAQEANTVVAEDLYRYAIAVRVGSIAQLPMPTRSPIPDAAVLSNRQRVISPGRDTHGAGERPGAAWPDNLHRGGLIRRCPIAKLSVRVVAPGPDSAVTLQRERVIGASRNRRHPRQPAHLGQHKLGGRVGIAKLPVGVRAPGPDSAIAREDEDMSIPGGNRGRARQRGDLGRHSAGCNSRYVRLPPHPDRAVLFQRQRELWPRRVSKIYHSGGDRPHLGQTRNLYRAEPITVCSVTELAVIVMAPGPDSAVTFQRQGVKIASGHRLHANQRPGPHRVLAGNWVGAAAGSLAKLAVIVSPPCPHRPIGGYGERMVTTGRNCGEGVNLLRVERVDKVVHRHVLVVAAVVEHGSISRQRRCLAPHRCEPLTRPVRAQRVERAEPALRILVDSPIWANQRRDVIPDPCSEVIGPLHVWGQRADRAAAPGALRVVALHAPGVWRWRGAGWQATQDTNEEHEQQ